MIFWRGKALYLYRGYSGIAKEIKRMLGLP
jgi:hypothetical protein